MASNAAPTSAIAMPPPAAPTAAAAASTSSSARPRLMILKMQVENFKSYGGVKEIGPFHKSFSSVVGPNGSGKSNVIDAMLFVFGKKSSKLRLNKLSELIHRSAEYPDLEYARVTVFFQEIIDSTGTAGTDDNYSIIPNSQFTVTRTAHKDNSSKYYINGKLASFTEVTTLLKGKGIDLDNNRFLILQGEVELISQMKPKAQGPHEEGLLEYLEDIVGSNAYVQPIEEAFAVLEQLTEQRNEKIKRVQIAEKDKAGLEGSKIEAEALLSKERDYSRKKGLLIQKSLAGTQHAVATTEVKFAEETAKLQAERAGMASFAGRVEKLEATLSTAEKAYSAAATEQEATQKAIRDLENEDVKLREKVKAAKAKQRQQEETIMREKTRIEEAHKTIAEATGALPTLETAVIRLQAEKKKEEADHDTVMSTLKGETEVLRKKLEAKQVELTPAAEKAVAAATALATAKTELRLIKEASEAATQQLAGLKGKAAQVKAEIAAKTNEKAALTKEYETGIARKAECDKQVAAAEAAENDAVEKAKVSRSKLEEAKAALVADGSRGTLVTQLMAAAKKGGPLANAGLCGRLGDLGRIDDKYDVAVTTCCPGLNWLVTETIEGAQACVDFLRAKNLGRAKFISLDKVTWAKDAMNKASTCTDTTAPRLFDLVTAKEEKFRSAFYFALRETLVAKDMEHATKVAYGTGKDAASTRYRVVTLTGEVIELAGTMSGGGKTVRKGGMSSTFAPSLSAAELTSLEQEASKTAAVAAEKRTLRSNITRELGDLEKILPKVAQFISKLEMEAVALAKIAEDIAAQITSQTAAIAKSGGPSAADEKVIADLTTKCAGLEATNAGAQAAAMRIEAEVDELKRQVVEVGGEKVARAKARLDRASEALEKTIKDVTKAKSDLKAAEKSAEKANTAAEAAVLEFNKAKEEFDALRAKIVPLEEEAMKLIDRLRLARETVVAREADVMKLRAEMETVSREVRIAREKEAALALAVSEMEAALDAGRMRAKDLQRALQDVAADYAVRMEEYVQDVMSAMIEAGEELEDEGRDSNAGGGSGGAAATAATTTTTTTTTTTSAAAAAAKIPQKVYERITEPLTLPMPSDAQLAAITIDALEASLAVLKGEREELSKKANLNAIKEYRAKEKDYLRRVAELEAVAKAREDERKKYEALRKSRLDTFMTGFNIITLRLKEMYQMITLGGDAELELVDSLDPFAEGIVFSVRPPKKSWKNISNLSGGEKTLSSLALVFALHHFKPTPLYVMDEIDAALDFKNVSIVANYIKERTKDAQFIIISLRNNMFELADRLVGIYKTKDVTKSVTINPKLVAANAAAAIAAADGGSNSTTAASGGAVGAGAGV